MGDKKQETRKEQKQTKEKTKKKDSKQVEELTALLKKVQADFENYKKRVEKEKQDFVQHASQEIIKELLPVIDSFQLALKHSDNQDIKMLYAQLWQILNLQGLKQIKALNQAFDPFLHQALMQENSDKPENIVIEELQTGYVFKDIVIRHSKVKVSKAIVKEKESTSPKSICRGDRASNENKIKN